MADATSPLHGAALPIVTPERGNLTGNGLADAIVDAATAVCAPQEESFGPGALVVLAVYIVFLLGIAAYGHLRSGSSTMANHYLAGSGLGSVVLCFSLFATAFSGYTLLGVPGSAYRDGYGAYVWVHTACTVSTTQVLVGPIPPLPPHARAHYPRPQWQRAHLARPSPTLFTVFLSLLFRAPIPKLLFVAELL